MPNSVVAARNKSLLIYLTALSGFPRGRNCRWSRTMGDQNVVFSTDHPHGDSDFPHATEEFFEIEDLSAESKI
jgi:hypothetical protein